MLREGAGSGGVGVPEAQAEGARPLGAGRYPAYEGELLANLRRRADCGGLSGRCVVRRVRPASPRTNHPGTPHRWPPRPRTSHRGAPAPRVRSCFMRAIGAAIGLTLLAACSGSPSGPSIIPGQMSMVVAAAGDIGRCDLPGAEATARLLDGIAGTVLALGDNAYPSGALLHYAECYQPTWGRHFDRTRPVPGNHEYETPGANGYFTYFGENA